MRVAKRMGNPECKKQRLSKADLKLIRTENFNRQVVQELSKIGDCPRYVDDVYALGLNIHYHVGAIYLELADLNQGSRKAQYKNLALKELQCKEEIERLAKYNYNQMLIFFYENGGPIIEAPVSEKMRNVIHPFFEEIMVKFLNQLNTLANTAAAGKIDVHELQKAINNNMIDSYTAICKLYDNDEIKKAFTELISVRKA